MSDSQRLLAEYVQNGSEAAFRELASRYMDLIYSAAIRLVDGDVHLAQDVAQRVLVDLARNARAISNDVMLGGWLHRHTCFVARKAMRTERRRRIRERRAVEMNELPDPSESSLAQIVPILDEAINHLGTADRTAVILRFFEQRDLRYIGRVMGTTENTARMRVTRALEKLQALLKRRGITYSAAGLGTLLASEAITAAPAGFALAASSAALASAALGTGATLALFETLTMTKLKLGVIGAIVAAGVAAPLVIQHQGQVKLRQENRILQEQVGQLARLAAESQRLSNLLAQAQSPPGPRLPAPPLRATTPPAEPPVEDLQQTNLMARLLKGETPKLTPEQVEAYLKENRRNAASLLAMFRATGDPALLKEALANYPDDPRVNFAAVVRTDASLEEKRQQLDAFEKSAPDNSLANYLSALDYFKSGQTDKAVQELGRISAKQQFSDYSWDFVENADEAWRAAGYSDAESSMVALWQLQLPQLAQLKDLNQNLLDLASSYRQAGDEASAQAALQLGLNLGQRLDGSATDPLISQLVGNAIQRAALGAMDPASPYGDAGQTVSDQLDQLTQEKTTLHDLAKQMDALQLTMTTQDWVNYNNRTRTFGEENALRWLIGKYGGK